MYSGGPKVQQEVLGHFVSIVKSLRRSSSNGLRVKRGRRPKKENVLRPPVVVRTQSPKEVCIVPTSDPCLYFFWVVRKSFQRVSHAPPSGSKIIVVKVSQRSAQLTLRVNLIICTLITIPYPISTSVCTSLYIMSSYRPIEDL